MDENPATPSDSSNNGKKSPTEGESDQSKIEDSKIKKEPDDNVQPKPTDVMGRLELIEDLCWTNNAFMHMLLEDQSSEGETTDEEAPAVESQRRRTRRYVKFDNFVQQPMGSKPVTAVPRIGKVQPKTYSDVDKTGKTGENLKEARIKKAVELFALYYDVDAADGKQDEFIKLIQRKFIIAYPSMQFKGIVKAFKAWIKYHLIDRACKCKMIGSIRECEEEVGNLPTIVKKLLPTCGEEARRKDYKQ